MSIVPSTILFDLVNKDPFMENAVLSAMDEHRSMTRANNRNLMAMDLMENEKNFIVHCEIPGVPKEAVDITIDNGLLTIKSCKEQMSETNEKNFHRKERVFGSITRSIKLPTNTDTDNVKAKFEQGLLELTFPKTDHPPHIRKIALD